MPPWSIAAVGAACYGYITPPKPNGNQIQLWIFFGWLGYAAHCRMWRIKKPAEVGAGLMVVEVVRGGLGARKLTTKRDNAVQYFFLPSVLAVVVVHPLD